MLWISCRPPHCVWILVVPFDRILFTFQDERNQVLSVKVWLRLVSCIFFAFLGRAAVS